MAPQSIFLNISAASIVEKTKLATWHLVATWLANKKNKQKKTLIIQFDQETPILALWKGKVKQLVLKEETHISGGTYYHITPEALSVKRMSVRSLFFQPLSLFTFFAFPISWVGISQLFQLLQTVTRENNASSCFEKTAKWVWNL